MIDAWQRASGHIERVADIDVPDLAQAVLVRSPIACGSITYLDASAARQVPGVVAVIGAAELAQAGLSAVRFGTIVQDQPILATERVRHVGEPVAIVVANSKLVAEHAATLVELALLPGAALLDAEAALAPDAAAVNDARESNELVRWGFSRGDMSAARASASHHFKGRWTSPVAQVASLETHAVTAAWTAGDRLELWTTSQSPSRVAQELARIFSLPSDHVRLHVPPLGGAFGGKNHAKLEPLIAMAARICGRPVRFVNSRAEEFVTITKHAMSVELESGVDSAGHLLYRSARLVAAGGAYANSSPVIPKAAGGAVLGPYRIGAAKVDAVVAYTNHPPAGSFRGLGVSQATWAGEQQLDEIAVTLGISPLEIRRRNLVEHDQRLPNGDRAHDAHWKTCLETAATLLDHPSPDRPGAEMTDPAWIRRGRGMAVAMKATMSPFRTVVRLSFHADDHVEVRASAVDMGQGARTVLARLTADAMEVPIAQVRVIDPDTTVTPFDATSSSSRTTHQHARAIELAAARLRDDIEEIATVVSRGAPRLRYAKGRVSDGSGDFDSSVAQLLRATNRDELVSEAEFVNEPQRDPDSGSPELTSHWHQGAVAVEISVDIETGRICVERACGAAWAGRVISVPGAELQNDGNIIFGIGPALFEEVHFDDGAPTPTSLRDYRIPSLGDMPPDLRTIALIDEQDEAAYPDGLGESLIPSVAPAIANALADAVGVRVRDLPMSPERVLAAIDAQEGRDA